MTMFVRATACATAWASSAMHASVVTSPAERSSFSAESTMASNVSTTMSANVLEARAIFEYGAASTLVLPRGKG